MSRFVILALLSLATPVLRAADPLPGHSRHGETFDEGPRQAATLMGGTGRVKFPVSTKNAEAQKFFEQGVGQLHGFWYLEAERSFRQAATLDPGCAMNYWGMAMANVNNDKRAKGFLAKAVERKDKADAREKMWITALENYYRDEKKAKKDRQTGFIRDLEAIVQEHPQDVEAKAFLVWKIWHAKGDAPISSAQAVDALLDQIFAEAPDHPAHHYRIHLWDDQKPARAVRSAAQCGQAASGIAHMWHMPGHTYSKLKRFDDAAWQQEASTRVDHAYQIKTLVLPDQIHNYAHNEEWLVRTFNELGRAADAAGLARSLIEIPRHPVHNTLDKGGCSASFGRTRLIETRLRWEQWEQLLSETAGPLVDTVPQTSHEITRLRARGVAQFGLDRAGELAATIGALEAIEKKEKEKAKQGAKKEPAAKEEIRKAEPASAKKPGKTIETAASGKGKARDNGKAAGEAKEGDKKPTPTALDHALTELRALALILKKDNAAAAKALDTPGDMPKERLAHLRLRLGDKAKALELTKSFPQDLSGTGSKAGVLFSCGKTDEAKQALEAAGKLAYAMDTDLPLARRLDDLGPRLGMKNGWRAPAPKRDDTGARPALATLGPVHWHAPEGRAWSALTPEGKTVTDRDFAGKNIVLVFYLGHQCAGCMEQLNAFADAQPKFKAAGLELIAITNDTPAEALKANEKSKNKKPFPFPILSDASMAAFKTFRAYDDFEKMGLHGCIFVDASGHIRWLDAGYKPFMEAQFLVDECQRLLRLPPAAGGGSQG